ncbi:NAD-dependent deacylase [Zoogloea sp.]|uniref:SIR2 family NAD-dependent protein deacylase n=1 Tax=Zoogloea sp. TaxID=49181 RepID=UPI00262FF0D5|nr:NAD-dependent deacylase [Zoogloea sp.]MDD3352462.1 NAD-dependent deacylase [Zoogloea sp.]
MNTSLSDQAAGIAAAGRLLNAAQRILFITGAGLSADSGLPTYRGVGGLYEDAHTDIGLPIEQALSGAMFRERPDITWRFLSQIESSCRGARPNPGHYAIARLEALHGQVTVLTQNVDGFHLEAGSRDVIEMHGTLRRLRCVDCGRARQVSSYAGLEIPPECPYCGGLLRPDVVLFGESLPDAAVHRYQTVLEAGPDLIVSVGTGSAFPYIAGPVVWAVDKGIPTIEINPGHTPLSEQVRVCLKMRAAEALPAMLDAAGYSLDCGRDARG